MKIKNIVALGIILIFLGVVGIAISFFVISANLPRLITLKDYKPLVVSEIYARDGQKIGEFSIEKRIVIPYSQIPKRLVQAFIAAEDKKFFEHKGINYTAILRASIANTLHGHTVQGGSTITQQVAKSLLLTRERTMIRKIKEAILATRMEQNLSKEDILYLYLNQIFLGHNAYGVEAAAQNYFRKHVSDLTLAESAILAGLPQAPSAYSPLHHPKPAKERQLYVLRRMVEDGYVTDDEAKQAAIELVRVYPREKFEEVAPYYKETVRQFLTADLGEEKVYDEGIKIYTGMDLKKQVAAQEALDKNLRDLDKRQGYRGPTKNLATPEEIAQFLVEERDKLIQKKEPFRVIYPLGKEPQKAPLDLNHKTENNVPAYTNVGQIVDGVVIKIDPKWGLVTVRFAESQGLIDLDDMNWARKPDTTKHYTEELIKDPAKVFKVGDLIEVKIKAEKFSSKRIDTMLGKKKPQKKVQLPPDLPQYDQYAALSLEQEPIAQAALLSFDLDTGDVISMVGGANFVENEYNRAIQAARQTGSAFKGIIYAAALEKGWTPASVIVDAPLVYEEGEGNETKTWKPTNFENKFTGDVLFRNALIKSMNVPTVKIIENIGIDWVSKYARRLGIFSPLNPDYTMALGSSGITLYEMVKAFSVYPRAGKRLHPVLIRKVVDADGKQIAENISLDEKFKKELDILEAEFHPEVAKKLAAAEDGAPTAVAAVAATPAPQTPPALGDKQRFDVSKVFDFTDPDQLISPQTAYLMTHLLKGVVLEGTGQRARSLNRPVAGKTGTTSGYYDAWFVGFTPHIAAGTWVGFDNEKSLGKFETGNAAALPIWVDYMNVAIEDSEPEDFAVPSGIVFANIDAETGKLASARSKKVVREAFREGTEPAESSSEAPQNEEKSFFKEDLSN